MMVIYRSTLDLNEDKLLYMMADLELRKHGGIDVHPMFNELYDDVETLFSNWTGSRSNLSRFDQLYGRYIMICPPTKGGVPIIKS